MSQKKYLSPICWARCTVKEFFHLKHLRQISQTNCFSAICNLLCSVNLFFFYESLLAYVTNIRFFSTVRPFVSIERRFLWKSLLTYFTSKWLFPSMYYNMRKQMCFHVKCLFAHLTGENRLATVQPFVPCQAFLPHETFLTDITLVAFSTVAVLVILTLLIPWVTTHYLHFQLVLWYLRVHGCWNWWSLNSI